MSKKQDEFYFNNFIECADYACNAAHLLEDVMDNFDPDSLPGRLDEMHRLEHAADECKHKMIDVLAKAFITPIEREDIIELSHCVFTPITSAGCTRTRWRWPRSSSTAARA